MNDRHDGEPSSDMDRVLNPEGAITLGMLKAVAVDSNHSQRSLARELGIALGLTNAYLKRCIRKGWIKVQQVPANRYAYFLTPVGFNEKARLTAEYLTSSLGFFRRARRDIDMQIASAKANGHHRLALHGAGDLAEIAALAALDHDVEIVGIIDPRVAPGRLAGLPIVPDMAMLVAVDAVLITELVHAQDRFDASVAMLGAARVFAPALLNVSRAPSQSEEA